MILYGAMIHISNRTYARRGGLPPGSLLNETPVEQARIRHIRYSESSLEIAENSNPAEIPVKAPQNHVDWIQIFGILDTEAIIALGDRFGIHRLTLEDIQNTDRRLGLESHDEYLFQTLKRLKPPEDDLPPQVETVGMVLKESTVLTFHDSDSEGYPHLIERLKNESGRLRRSGAAYLAYSLMDEAVDTWLSHTEEIETGLLRLEEDVLFHYRDELIGVIHQWKKRLAWLRWLFRPYRDLRFRLSRDGERWFPEDIRPFLSDLTDHATRVSDILELFREMADDLLTVHMTTLSNRMNGIMKVLTVISTIFIPMTFLAGIYGMNFARMPELGWRWGYPAALGLMALSALVMVLFFKKKKWL